MASMQSRHTAHGPAGIVEVVRDDPQAVPGQAIRGVAVIAHPHPLFGGTMDNKVVHTLARAFVQCGWSAVRFNFRGVGASQGDHDDGRGEMDDMLAVVAQQAAPGLPLALGGFSFGAFVAASVLTTLWPARPAAKAIFAGIATSRFAVPVLPPAAASRTLTVHGEQDDTVPLASVFDWARPQGLPVTVIPGGGHFFHGQLPLLRDLAMRHIRC
jgi:alpha/beta superfamily hydrolase